MPEISPALQLAVDLLAQGRSIAATLCSERPADLADVARVAMGTGLIDAHGGLITLTQDGWIECIAYDVGGQLVVSAPSYCPAFGRIGARAKVGTLSLSPDVKRQ